MFQVNELLEWLSTGRIGRSFQMGSRIPDRDRLAQDVLLRYPEQLFRRRGSSPRVAGASEVAHRGTETLSRRGEQDALCEAALVIRVQVRNFRVDDDSNPSACTGKVSRFRAVDSS